MKYINTDQAPKAIGPYSQAVWAGNFLFCSGQIGLDPATSELVTGGIKEQTERVMLNVQSVLESAELGLFDVVKTEVYLTSMSNFTEMNKVYGEFFKEHKPARATVAVSQLPKQALVEIACVACNSKNI